jgi:SAM-dependent methyltransferase
MAWDPVWEDTYRARPWGSYPGEDVIRFVAANFYQASDRSRVRLLELGSGTGANLWFMAREGFCVHGVEGSATGVQLAAERLDRECPGWRERGGRLLTADIASLPYPDAYFDGALDVVAICYSSLTSARAIYAELARVVRPGGKLFVRTFERGCWGDGTGTQAGPYMWHCADGPLAGFGATRFTAREDVASLMPDWRIDCIEHAIVTQDSGRHWIMSLQIHGTRP